MKKIFFSHSLTTYNTTIEDDCLAFLQKEYFDHNIVNPKYILMDKWIIPITPEEQFKREMEYYFLPRVRECNILAYYKDDSYSPGVDMEISEATKLGIPVVRITLNSNKLMQLTETERATIRAWLEERIEFNTHPLDVQRIVEIGKLMKELEVQSDVSVETY